MTQEHLPGLSREEIEARRAELRAESERAVSEVFAQHSLPLRRIVELAIEAEAVRRKGNRARTARALGVSRSQLYRRLGRKPQWKDIP